MDPGMTEAEARQQEQAQAASEAQLEAQVKERQRRRREAEEAGEDAPSRTPQQTMRAAAKGDQSLTTDEIHDALEVFLAPEGDEPEVEPHTMKLNVGTAKKPKYVRWTVVPVDDEEIVKIRKDSTKGNRARRRAGEAEVDENLVARRIVSRGTVEPDLGQIAAKLGSTFGPDDALLAFFRKFGKTGLILQISGEILNISGYDDDDVSELDAASG